MPDPLKPTTVYGVGYGAGQRNWLIKIDLATGQWGNVAPNFGTDSVLDAAGRDFWNRLDTAFNPNALYGGYNCILVTRCRRAGAALQLSHVRRRQDLDAHRGRPSGG